MYSKNMKSNNIYKIILLFVILYEVKISKENNLKLLNLNNEITITIKGNGQILSNYQNNTPSEIIVNNKTIQNFRNDYYIENLGDEINKITIKWNEPLTNCSHMFYYLKNIINIDLSNFDSSKVITMYCMFSGSELISLDLSKLNTSSVYKYG